MDVIQLASCAVVLQVLAIVFAVKNLRLTGDRFTWGAISAALLLLAVIRLMTLHFALNYDKRDLSDVVSEAIGVALSFMVLIGIAWIGERRRVEDSLARLNLGLIDANRKLAENADQQWHSTFDSMHDLVMLLAPDGRIVRCNRALCELTGKTAAEIVGRRCWEVMHGTSGPICGCPCERMKASLCSESEDMFFKGNWFYVTTEPILDAAGRLTGITHIMTDITQRKLAEERIREVSHRLHRALDEERGHIAREIHDSTGQKVAAIVMNLGLLEDSVPRHDTKAVKLLDDTLALSNQCAQELRTLSYMLHPPLLKELGLASALRSYVNGLMKRSDSEITVDMPSNMERLPEEVELTMFRVVQESLANAVRYSGSRKVSIRLSRVGDQLVLEVTDYGKGISAATMKIIRSGSMECGLGIAGMRERMRLINGTLDVESSPAGTVVRASVELHKADHESAKVVDS